MFSVVAQKSKYSSSTSAQPDESREANPNFVAAEERGVLWLWPNRAPKEQLHVMFVRRLVDCDSSKLNKNDISVRTSANGMIATGSTAARLTCWSLASAKVASNRPAVPPHLKRTGQNTCQCLLLLHSTLHTTPPDTVTNPSPMLTPDFPAGAPAASLSANASGGEVKVEDKKDGVIDDEGPMLLSGGSEGLVMISSASNGRVLCQFAAAVIQYFKAASLTDMSFDMS